MAAMPEPDHGQTSHAPAVRPDRPLRAEFIAVTNDDVLLEQIGQALDGESTVRHVETAPEAREFLRPTQPCVLLLDAQGLEDPATIVQGLQSPDVTSVVVVFAPADRSADVARAIRGSTAFAVLPIPVEPAQAMAVIEGAREEALARYSLAASQRVDGPAATVTTPTTAVTPAPEPAPELVLVPAPTPAVETAEVAVPARPAVRPAVARMAPPQVKAARTDSPPPTGGDSGGSRARILVFGVAAIVGLAAAVAWFVLREPAATQKTAAASVTPAPSESSAATPPSEKPESVTAPVIVPEALQAGTVDELLDRARTAIRERHYTEPEGDNALNYYRSVLAQEPGNGEASEGLQRIAAVLHDRAQAALTARRLDEAARTIAQLRSVRPDHPDLPPLEGKVADAQIAAALAEGNVERANNLLRQSVQAGTLPASNAARWRGEIERQQGGARAEQLARLVSLRIREGKLVDPASDSAKLYLAQMRRLPQDQQQLAGRATTELQQAYLKKFREATAQGEAAEAERWQAEARALGVSATELAAIQRDTSSRVIVKQAQQATTDLAQMIQQRIADGRLLEPSGDSALFHLNALRKADPTSAALAANERALSTKLLDQGRSALAERNVYRAQASVAAARQLGVNLDQVAALERDVAAAGTAEAATPAAAQAKANEPASPVQLKRTRYVAPEYPPEAMHKKLAGEVRVRVTVQADGKVKDAVVVSASPAGVFDEAALAAARKWRFKPLGKDDSGLEASAVTSIVFQP